MGGLRLNWWTNGIRLDVRIRPAGLALAALYALACWATRQISLDQFYLPAGIRVAALLLCPPRLWGYLILGEYAYFAQMRYPMIDRYGLPWVVQRGDLGGRQLRPGQDQPAAADGTARRGADLHARLARCGPCGAAAEHADQRGHAQQRPARLVR